MKDEDVLTAPEVAGILRIAKNTVYELVKRGELKCYRVGTKFRFDRSDIEAYKRSMRGGSEPALPGASVSVRDQPASPVSVSASDAPTGRNVRPAGSFVLCGQDVLLDVLARRMEIHPAGGRVLRSYQGSYNGLYDLYTGSADAATAHLWDGESGSYNLPYLRHLLPGTAVTVIRLATRVIGFYVKAGNPKGLSGWEDLRRMDLAMVNRELGSGIRVLIDERLRLSGLDGTAIPGYDRVFGTHLAVAAAIARGGADFAIGNEKSCRMVSGVDFVPLQEERYDLVFRTRSAGTPPFAAMVDIIRSADFREELEGLGGYGLSETGKIIAG